MDHQFYLAFVLTQGEYEDAQEAAVIADMPVDSYLEQLIKDNI